MRNSLLEHHQQRQYSVDRLRYLYSDLLHCVDDNEHLSRRSFEKSNAKRFFFRDRLGNSSLGSKWFNRNNGNVSQDLDGDVEEIKEEQSSEDEYLQLKKRELAVAFRLLAATRAADKEENNIGAASVRDDASAQANKAAKKLEKELVDIIRGIGEVIVNALKKPVSMKVLKEVSQGSERGGSLRDDEVFEYFCEKAILSLLVDIVKDKPSADNTCTSCFHGVVWSPKVKAQVFHTVSLLVAGVRDASALYYIMSQHCINQLIISMLPLQQWTYKALETMLPPYVDLLKTLSLQISSSPELFPFFTVQDKANPESNLFPLFSAVITVLKSSYSRSDSFIHASCLNLTVGLMNIEQQSIRQWICHADREHRYLAEHLCELLLERYQRIINLTTGPVVDAVRSKAIEAQLDGLKHQLDALNDVFWCDIQVLNVRICEALLRRFVAVLLRDIVPDNYRHMLMVGVSDTDVTPDEEAAAQVATLVLSRLFNLLEYSPFIRMLAVALFHPCSSHLWKSETFEDKAEYALTLELNAIVQGKAEDTIDNPYRTEFIRGIRGDYGEWRVVPSVFLIENILNCSYLDLDILIKLDVLPKETMKEGEVSNPAPSIEKALSHFLTQNHAPSSMVVAMSLECSSSLALLYLYKSALRVAENGKDTKKLQFILAESSLRRAFSNARSHFYRKTLESKSEIGVSDIFVDVVEASVQNCYKRYTAKVNDVIKRGFAYNLSHHGTTQYATGAQCLVRRMRGVGMNDIEMTRFYCSNALHFRAICRVIDKFRSQLDDWFSPAKMASQVEGNEILPPLNMVDEAVELSSIFGSLMPKPAVGTDIDLQGRMSFRFSTCTSKLDSFQPKLDEREKENTDNVGPISRFVSEDLMMRSGSNLVLVLDPTDLLVVKAMERSDVSRGTILCCISLLNVIAAAEDGNCLHVAVRNENLGCLIKNGNMVFTLDSPGTCLIVKQYLDRSRNLLRKELLNKIENLFTVENSFQDKTEEAQNDSVSSVELQISKTL